MVDSTPWPKRCPRGHTSVRWLKTKQQYRCKACAYTDGVDSYYDKTEIRIIDA